MRVPDVMLRPSGMQRLHMPSAVTASIKYAGTALGFASAPAIFFYHQAVWLQLSTMTGTWTASCHFSSKGRLTTLSFLEVPRSLRGSGLLNVLLEDW